LTTGESGTGVSNPEKQAQREVKETRALSWETCLDTYLPALVFALGTGVALPAIPTLARSFHVSFGIASGVLTAFLLGGTVGTIPTGWLIDRFGRRRIMLAGPILTATLALLVCVSQNFPELLVLRFLDGWAAQMWLLGRLTGISARAGSNQRGRQVSWMFGMDTVGRLSGPIAGGFIAIAWGLRAPFAAYALLALATLIPVLLFIRDVEDGPLHSRSEAVGTRQKLTARQIIQPRLAFFILAFFAALARGPIFADLFHLYAAFQYNLGPKAIGLLATSGSATSLPVGFLAGWLMDRFGRRRTLIPGFCAVTCAMLLLGLTALLHAPLSWYVAAFLTGVVSQSLTSGSIQTIGADVAPPEARGFFLGLWNFTNQGGLALSPIAFAFVSDSAGYPSAFVMLAGAALVVAVLLIGFVPETGRQRPPVGRVAAS
jgi:MFS family permease